MELQYCLTAFDDIVERSIKYAQKIEAIQNKSEQKISVISL